MMTEINMQLKSIDWNDKSYECYIGFLKSLSEEKYRQFSMKLVPGEENIIGIRMPELRKIASEISKGNWRDFIRVSEDNIRGYHEEIMIMGFVIGKLTDKNSDINEIILYIDKFLNYIKNWAVNDSFCSSLKITKKYKDDIITLINNNLESDNPWRMRFSIVMLMTYYIEEKNLEMIFNICEKYRHDEYYYKMAVAWLLSMCFVKFGEETMNYFKICTIDDFTYNKAIQKTRESRRVTKEDKDILKNMKRSIGR